MNNSKIRFLLFTLSLMFSASANAQEIFAYEKEISNKDNYILDEVNFTILEKKESIIFSGTLIRPKTVFNKVVIIMPGSGRDTRNSHYKLTEELLKNNVAVYRYDERGVGKSGGIFNNANYTVSTMGQELLSAYNTIKAIPELAQKKIGFLGHSQGGLVTMAAINNGALPDFLVQWAAPVQKYGALVKYQVQSGQFPSEYVFKDLEIDKRLEIITVLHKVVEENLTDDDWDLYKKLNKASKKLGYTNKNYVRFPYLSVASEKDIVRQNFEPLYQSIAIPLLYVVGDRDTFVDPVAETELLKSFGNKNITIKTEQGLNHYLTNGSLKEQQQSMYDIKEDAMHDIVNWIVEVQ